MTDQRQDCEANIPYLGGTWVDRPDWSTALEGRHFNAPLADNVRFFAEHGYVILENAASHEAIDRFRDAISAAFRKGNSNVLYQLPGDHQARRLDEPVDTLDVRAVDSFVPLPTALELLATPALLDFLEAIFEEPALLFQSLSFVQGSQQGLHKDTAYVVVNRPHELAACWIALEDVQDGSGELIYVPGSHRDPAFLFGEGRTHWNRELDGDEPHWTWSREIEQRAQQLGVQRFLPKKGDILVWHALLAHGGAPIFDKNLTRQSLVGHYCPRSARPYYFDNPPFRSTLLQNGRLAYASSHYELGSSPDNLNR